MFRRFYHVSATSFNHKKLGAKLCKMIKPNAKRQWHPTYSDIDALPSVKSLTKVKHEPSKKAMHRVAVLNKLFMKHITDIMSTGTPSMDIVGRGIEISKVNVSPDLQRVNVFWVCKGNSTDEDTERFLNKIAGPIRHELSILRLMGEIPFIAFVKDIEETRLADLDRRLAIADYGEDFVPSDPGHLLKSEFTLVTELSSEIKAKLKQLENEIPTEEEPIPEMSNNVFGLDHHDMLSRLVAVRKKTVNAWNNVHEERSVMSFRRSSCDASNVEHIDNNKQRTELAEFLLKRQIEQKRLYKEKNSRDDNIAVLHDDVTPEVDHRDDFYYEEDEDEEFTEDHAYEHDPVKRV